jgi:uncharacterized membrane protein YhaH (DUF805 family)
VSAALGALVGVMNGGETIATVFGVLSFVVYLVALVALLIQRSHDMDLSGLVDDRRVHSADRPVLGVQGRHPRRQPLGSAAATERARGSHLRLLLPILFVVGVVAAIALPAFQTYTMRGSVGALR